MKKQSIILKVQLASIKQSYRQCDLQDAPCQDYYSHMQDIILSAISQCEAIERVFDSKMNVSCHAAIPTEDGTGTSNTRTLYQNDTNPASTTPISD